MKRKPSKKKVQLLDDFLELGEKCNIKIIHDKGDFNGDNCLLFSNDTIVINGNGLDEDVLNEANINEVETVLALTNDDENNMICLLYTSPSPRDLSTSRMPSSA